MQHPNNHPSLTESTPEEVVPPIFRLGDGKYSTEKIIGEKRIFSWALDTEDRALAEIAGWDVFTEEFTAEEGSIQIPQGTRNARSVLSGTEAWSGEKRSIIEDVVSYLFAVYSRYGEHDIRFSWGQVGVTPMHEVFIAPPNTPHVASDEDIDNWKQTLVEELGLILKNDEDNYDSVESFRQNINRLTEHGS